MTTNTESKLVTSKYETRYVDMLIAPTPVTPVTGDATARSPWTRQIVSYLGFNQYVADTQVSVARWPLQKASPHLPPTTCHSPLTSHRTINVATQSGRSVVRVFAHGAMGRRIDPSWGGPIELFLVPRSEM